MLPLLIDSVNTGLGNSGVVSVPIDGRSALLAAALQELAENGPAQLSLRAVARRAGVSHAAPKNHFEDRAGLLTALAAEGFVRLTERFRRTKGLESMTPAEQFATLGKTYVDFSLAESELFEVMYGTEPLHADDEVLMAERKKMFALLLSIVGDGEGSLPAVSLGAWAQAHGLVMLMRDGSLARVTGAKSRDEVVQIIYRLIDDHVGTYQT
jgi:AcrR family transcriptional regulator